jgi:hypothetical protein
MAGRIWIPDELRRVRLMPRRRLHCDEMDSPVTDETNRLAAEVVGLVPVSTVEKLALVVLQAVDIRPLPVVQETSGVDEDVGVVVDDGTVSGGDLDIPLNLLGVPCGGRDRVAEFDVLLEIVLCGESLEVAVDFSGAGVDRRPGWVGLETPGVGVSRDIAGASKLVCQ